MPLALSLEGVDTSHNATVSYFDLVLRTQSYSHGQLVSQEYLTL